MRRIRVVLAFLGTFAMLCSLSVAITSPSQASSLDDAFTSGYVGGNFTFGRVLGSTGSWTKKAVTWKGNGLKLTGTATIPNGTGPHPVVVLAHGYIDPQIYTTGRGFTREQDWLARNGFVALHVDYRNHAGSDDDPRNDVDGRIGYAADVITAALAVRKAAPNRWDTERIALMGRSMGGSVTMNALVIRPGLFDAGVIISSVSSRAAENFNRWQRKDYPIAQKVARIHGLPEDNPSYWKGISPRTHFDRIIEPVLMFHGTIDSTCPIRWARKTHHLMEDEGVDVRYVEYPGEGHNFYGTWDDSMRTTVKFLRNTMG